MTTTHTERKRLLEESRQRERAHKEELAQKTYAARFLPEDEPIDKPTSGRILLRDPTDLERGWFPLEEKKGNE